MEKKSRQALGVVDNDTGILSPQKEKAGQSGKTVLVVNPNSGGGRTGRTWEELYVEMKKALGPDTEVEFTKKAGDGTIITRDLLRRGVDRIIPVGGDGTINEVANGFFEERVGINRKRGRKGDGHPDSLVLKPINPDAVMGVVPGGTRNVLVRSLGLKGSLVECCANFTRGTRTKIDVIAASATNPETLEMNPARVYLNAAEMGVAGEIIHRSKRVRNAVKSRLVSTVTAILATVPSYESNLCELEIDSGREKVLTKMTLGVVANGKFLGGGFMAAPIADVSDGLFDMVVLKDSGSLKMIDELAKIKSGDYRNEGDIIYAQGKSLMVKSKERQVTVTIDGEPIGILPALFRVQEKALTVML